MSLVVELEPAFRQCLACHQELPHDAEQDKFLFPAVPKNVAKKSDYLVA